MQLRSLLFAGCAAAICTSAPAAEKDAPSPGDIEGIWTGEARHGDETGFIGFRFFRAKDGVRFGTLLWMPHLNNYGSFVGEVKTDDGKLGIPDSHTPMQLTDDTLRGSLYVPDLTITVRRAGELTAESEPPADLPVGPAATWTYDSGSEFWTTPALGNETAYIGDRQGRVHAVNTKDGSARWVVDTGAAIFGPITIHSGALFLTNDSGHMLKLDAANGRELWRAPIGGAGVRSLPDAGAAEWDFTSPAPAVHDGVVYIGSASGVLHALDAATGESRWTFTTSGKIRGDALVTADRVYFGSADRFVYALDRARGELIWKFDTGGPVTTAPMLAGDKLIIGTRDAALLYGLRASDGQRIWSVFFWLSWVESTPVLADDGLLYIGASDSRRVRCIEPDTGRIRWATQVWGWTWGTPLVRGDTVYYATAGAPQYFISQRASISALDRATGQLRWRTPLPLRENAYLAGAPGSLVTDSTHLIASGFDGKLCAYPLP